jgi:hypothetical protein
MVGFSGNALGIGNRCVTEFPRWAHESCVRPGISRRTLFFCSRFDEAGEGGWRMAGEGSVTERLIRNAEIIKSRPELCVKSMSDRCSLCSEAVRADQDLLHLPDLPARWKHLAQ